MLAQLSVGANMAWGSFNAGCPCCKGKCRVQVYPYGGGPASRITESNFYYGLNVANNDVYYNPHTGKNITYTETTNNIGISLDKIDILVFATQETCVWRMPTFGMTEIANFIQRGKTVLMFGEIAGCYAASGIRVNNDMLAALGSNMNIQPTHIYGGCQTIDNRYRSGYNNLNWNINKWGLGGSSVVLGGTPIIQDNSITLVAAETFGPNFGKLLLFGDENMFSSCPIFSWQLLMNNICDNEKKSIFATDDKGKVLA